MKSTNSRADQKEIALLDNTLKNRLLCQQYVKKVDPKYFHSAIATDDHQMECVHYQNDLTGFFEFIVELFGF